MTVLFLDNKAAVLLHVTGNSVLSAEKLSWAQGTPYLERSRKECDTARLFGHSFTSLGSQIQETLIMLKLATPALRRRGTHENPHFSNTLNNEQR